MQLLERHRVFNEVEIRARYEIKLEGYCKIRNIEARTMLEMVYRDIFPGGKRLLCRAFHRCHKPPCICSGGSLLL